MAPSRLPPDGTPLALRPGLVHVPPIKTLPELHCELRSAAPDYALAALNAFVAPKYRFAANREFVERSLDQAQRAFPEHTEVFARLRTAYGIRSHLPSRLPPPASSRRSRVPSLHLQEQRQATDELHSRLRGSSHADAVTALDDFIVDAISDWNPQFALASIDDAERSFQEHSEAFAYIRSEWCLPPLASGSMPVTPTSPRSPTMIPARPLSPASPRLGSGMMSRPSLLGIASAEAPPEYTKMDPDPSSTRLLEASLAAAVDRTPGLGMNFLLPAPVYAGPVGHPQSEDVDMLSDDEGHDVNDSPVGHTRTVHIALGGVPLEREANLSGGPTYTFTAEELAGVEPPRRRARSEGPGRRSSVGAPPQRPPARTQSPPQVEVVAQFRAADPYNTPTYTFTADELAGVGEYRRPSLGWKVFIPRRLSVPIPDSSPPKLFRSLSRDRS